MYAIIPFLMSYGTVLGNLEIKNYYKTEREMN